MNVRTEDPENTEHSTIKISKNTWMNPEVHQYDSDFSEKPPVKPE